MLVIRRKQEERCFIRTPSGDVITILVVEAPCSGVRFGIDAPGEYSILRDNAVKTERSKPEVSRG